MRNKIFYWKSDENNAKQVLLAKFLDSLRHVDIPDKIELSFKSYDLDKYPDQELLRSEINNNYEVGINSGFYYYAGVRYDSYEDLFNELLRDRKILELTI